MSNTGTIASDQFIRWANDNQGVLAIILFSLPIFWWIAVAIYRRTSSRPGRYRITEEFAHAEKLKKEVEQQAKWEPVWGSYGEFLIRDIDRKLPHTQENHSDETARHSIVVLTKIEREHLEFTSGSNFGRYIQQKGDRWYFARKEDEGAIFVEHIFWINYRDIEFVRWETDEHWEWPQVCCRFSVADKFPFQRAFFAVRETAMPRPYYREICNLDEVTELPDGLRS